MSTESAISELERLNCGDVTREVSLARFSRWQVGGTAKAVFSPASISCVALALSSLKKYNCPIVVVGDRSNLLFDDLGFNGIIVHIGRMVSHYNIVDNIVTAESGVWVPAFVRSLVRNGLSGLQHAIGIPGTLGGLVAMNGGSQRKSIGTHVLQVSGCDYAGQPFSLERDECEFSYRSSIMQHRELIVLKVILKLEKADPKELRRESLAILRDRRHKFPHKLPNCGSVFLSNPAMYNVIGPPGEAIERVGLKGAISGHAQISPNHANFIVNTSDKLGECSSNDILKLIHLAREKVFQTTGFWMDSEVKHISSNGVVKAAHEQAKIVFGQ